MENSEKKVNSDLQRFIARFEPNKFKVLDKGIEVRGAIDLHRSISEAKRIIEVLKLKLVVLHTAEMLSFRGFQVNIA